MNKEFTMELEFKEPLTPAESTYLQKHFDIWKIQKELDGLYHVWSDSDYPLYSTMIYCQREMHSIIQKLSKCVINGMIPNDDILVEWKENGKI